MLVEDDVGDREVVKCCRGVLILRKQKTRPKTDIDEIGPFGGKIQFRDEGYALRGLGPNCFIPWVSGKRDHGGHKLRAKGCFVYF